MYFKLNMDYLKCSVPQDRPKKTLFLLVLFIQTVRQTKDGKIWL